MKKQIRIATHNGIFHADDVFACASLLMIHPNATIVRTRDASVLAECDIVVDVGGQHDPVNKKFDHHQRGFDCKRLNGIPYSGFGLVWKEYGAEITGDKDVAERVDTRLVQVIDAIDNGVELATPTKEGVSPYSLSGVISLFNPTWDEDTVSDDCFQEAVILATKILKREILVAASHLSAKNKVLSFIKKGDQILVLETSMPWQEHLLNDSKGDQVLFVVFKSLSEGYMVQAVPDQLGSFGKRKALPNNWAGVQGEELDRLTGLSGCIFCHKGLFICGNKTLEGAIAMAKLACQD